MPTFGTIKRAYPRIEVLRGFNPNEPFTRSQSHPVASGVTIKSGMAVIEKVNGATGIVEWILPTAAEIAAGVAGRLYFAYNDSTDEDVLEAGTLPALSSLGEFEIESPFILSSSDANAGGYALTIGSALTLCDENDYKTSLGITAGNAKGWLRPVRTDDDAGGPHTADASGTPIVGRVTRNVGYKSIAGTNSNVVWTSVVSFYTVSETV